MILQNAIYEPPCLRALEMLLDEGAEKPAILLESHLSSNILHVATIMTHGPNAILHNLLGDDP